MAMISDPDDFYTKGCGRCERFATPDCSARLWGDGLDPLRRICLDMDLQETVKWGHPCFMHAGRNIAIFGAFRADFRLTFLNAGLVKDTEGVLPPQGPGSQTPSMIRFTAAEQVADKAPVIRAYLRQLMDHAEAGTHASRSSGARSSLARARWSGKHRRRNEAADLANRVVGGLGAVTTLPTIAAPALRNNLQTQPLP